MKAELLNKIPISGSIEEKHFDVGSVCSWVIFEDENYCEWAGVFGVGWGGATAVVLNDLGVAFVISKGQGFIVDVNSKKLLHKTECDYFKRVIAVVSKNMFLATDDLHLYLFEDGELIHTTDRVALDGIELLSATSNEIKGRLWGLNEWHTYTFEIGQRKLDCNWVYDLD